MGLRRKRCGSEEHVKNAAHRDTVMDKDAAGYLRSRELIQVRFGRLETMM